MSKSLWNGPAALGLACALCLLFLGHVIWIFSAYQTEIRMRRDQTASQHIEYAQDRIRRTCLDRDFAALLECITIEIISAQDHGRAESDLDAQEDMALWAKLMAVVSFLGLGITSFGVYLVWGTLDQTRVATKAAQDAVAVTKKMGRMQTQAYLSFSGTSLHYLIEGAVPVSLQVRPEFKNTGQSPGTIVYGFCDTFFLADLVTPFHHKAERFRQYRMNLNIGPHEKRWITGPLIKIEQISSAIANGRMLVVIGCIEFTDVFDDTRRVEDFCVGITFHKDPSMMENGVGAAHHWNAHQEYSVNIK